MVRSKIIGDNIVQRLPGVLRTEWTWMEKWHAQSAPPFLSADELSALTGYKANQFARMRKWLRDRSWPFEDPGRGGCPRVWRSYHNQRMCGTATLPSLASNDCSFAAPNRARLEALQDGRKKKNA